MLRKAYGDGSLRIFDAEGNLLLLKGPLLRDSYPFFKAALEENDREDREPSFCLR